MLKLNNGFDCLKINLNEIKVYVKPDLDEPKSKFNTSSANKQKNSNQNQSKNETESSPLKSNQQNKARKSGFRLNPVDNRANTASMIMKIG
jgi:hypothetical protein